VKRLLVLLLLLASPARGAPPDISGFAYQQHPGARLPLGARFTDAAGRSVKLGDLLAGRPTILALVYFHCPNLCGVVREDLFSALANSGLAAQADYTLVALSIDPRETSADAAAAEQAEIARYPAAGAAQGWHFLTGDAAGIRAVADAVGFRDEYDAALQQFIHPAGVVFATGAGVVSGYLLGVGYTPGEVRAGVLRASAGGIARAALPILLICFHYDPTTGRYTLAILRILKIMAALFALTLGATLLLTLRGGRRA